MQPHGFPSSLSSARASQRWRRSAPTIARVYPLCRPRAHHLCPFPSSLRLLFWRLAQETQFASHLATIRSDSRCAPLWSTPYLLRHSPASEKFPAGLPRDWRETPDLYHPATTSAMTLPSRNVYTDEPL